VQYGVVIFWGMSESEIFKVLTAVLSTRYMVDPLSEDEVEQDTFSVVIGPGNGSIANDTITLPPVYYNEWRIKMAISHALAQSAKLCLYEERMGHLVASTKDMPTHLAKTGKVHCRMCMTLHGCDLLRLGCSNAGRSVHHEIALYFAALANGRVYESGLAGESDSKGDSSAYWNGVHSKEQRESTVQRVGHARVLLGSSG
jgi:hypothetical protein